MAGAVAAASLSVLVVACGGEEAAPPTSPPGDPAPQAPPAEREPPSAEGSPGRDEGEPSPGGRPPQDDPEAAPGGAGDEEPIRSEAVLTGRDGRITPRVVRVPAFIAVRVELRSADGATYRIVVDGRALSAAGSRRGTVTLEGLLPGERYRVRASPGPGAVIEASAEPGP